MNTIQELHDRASDFLTRPMNDLPVAVEAEASRGPLEELGPSSPVQEFSVFIPGHERRALALARRFMELANAQPGNAGLEAVLQEAERAAQHESIELVKYALLVFITHHPQGRRLPIPPLEERFPQMVTPSKRGGVLEDMGALGEEAKLDYFREDTAVNDHHSKWHVVYPGGGIPNPADPSGPPITKDRQGELFWYMHQQMLARYDAERLGVGLPAVEPLADYRAPIPEGYEANLPGFSNRPQSLTLAGFPGQYDISDQEDRRDRLLAAAGSGFFERNGGRVPVEASLLGDTMEANLGSVDGEAWQDPLSFYGMHHNMGHVLIASVPDPNLLGVMRSTATAVRDPVFFRWHRHVDDTFFSWQEKLPPNDFGAGAPRVRIRKGLDGGAAANQSPDILLALAAAIPGADSPGFDGKAFGEATFGGSHWNDPLSSFPMLTGELHTTLRQQQIVLPNGSTVAKPYLDHDEFFYFLRLENLGDQDEKVTVRIFLVAQELAKNRRMWIEMDKFVHSLGARQKSVVFRPARQSAVVRKPARRPSEPAPPRPPGAVDQNYCDCGWPYHLLLPRGNERGLGFRFLVMLTDGQADLAGAEKKCGSMSFCGARDAQYPDRRAMGYPFDRPFAARSIAESIAAQDNMATRDITIRHVAP